MPTFLMTSRHTSENCPQFNEKTRKVYVEFFNKLEGLLKKHGAKMPWAGIVFPEHLAVYIFETPSLEAYQKFSMEPEFLALIANETCEVKLVTMNFEEALKSLKVK